MPKIYRSPLRAAMRRKAFTANDLAAAAGVSESLVRHILNGIRSSLSEESIVRLARALDLEPSEITSSPHRNAS